MSPIHIDSTYGVVIHRNFSPLYADEKYAQLFGFKSIDDVMNLNSLFDIIDPKFHSAAQQAYNNVMSKKEQPRVRSYVNQDINGKLFSVLTVDHIIDWEGEPALQITVIDMSMVDKTNQKITEQEQKYKDLICNSLQGIVVHHNFIPLMVNPAFVDIIGAESATDVIGNSLLCIIPEHRIESATTIHNQLISGEIQSNSDIVENIRFDGETRYFQLYESAILWDGQPAIQSSIIDITDKYLLEQQFKYQATHDELTGLLNRRAMIEQLNKQNDLTKCPSSACLLIDIDNFKLINDQFGHLAGDEVIKRFSLLCKKYVGDAGYTARWGGEEFMIFLPLLNLNEAHQVAKEILYNCEHETYECLGNQHTVTVSIGISTCLPKYCNIEALIQDADNNMYKAKQQGKNQIVLPH